MLSLSLSLSLSLFVCVCVCVCVCECLCLLGLVGAVFDIWAPSALPPSLPPSLQRQAQTRERRGRQSSAWSAGFGWRQSEDEPGTEYWGAGEWPRYDESEGAEGGHHEGGSVSDDDDDAVDHGSALAALPSRTRPPTAPHLSSSPLFTTRLACDHTRRRCCCY
jgi:hypothetical protein